MACHELAGLRLGLMNVLGLDDPAEKQHELAELGNACDEPGPIRSLVQAKDLNSLQRFFEAALVRLEERVSSTPANHADLPYLRTLMVLTKNVELELRRQVDGLTRMWRDLEEMHDFTHELYPKD